METKDDKESLLLHAKLEGTDTLLKMSRRMFDISQLTMEVVVMVTSIDEWINDLKLLGSMGEGFFLSNLGSSSCDMDIMAVSGHAIVYEHRICHVPDSAWLFQMQSCPKNSGYVRLRVRKEGDVKHFYPQQNVEYSLFDYESDCLHLTNAMYWHNDSHLHSELHNAFFSHTKNLKEVIVNSGPCRTTKRHFMSITGCEKRADIDLVLGIRCSEWPSVAKEWILRDRVNGWPSQEFIDQHVPNGCYVVPVGCKECKSTHLDWRISFAHVEVALVQHMNANHVKCFVLLRQLKRDFFEVKIPNVISSYLIKTTLFWTIEETPPELWQPHKLLTAVKVCLDKLISFIQNDFCPNYFIRTCNLLIRRYSPVDKGRVLQTCSEARRNPMNIFCKKLLPVNDMLLLQETLNGNILDIVKTLRRVFLNIFLNIILQKVLSEIRNKPLLIEWCRTVPQKVELITCKYEFSEENEIITKHLYYVKERFLRGNASPCKMEESSDSECAFNDVDLDDVNSIANICHILMVVENYTGCNDILKNFLEDQKHRVYRRLSHLDIGKFLELPSMEKLRTSKLSPDAKIPCISDLFFLKIEGDTLPAPLQIELDSLLLCIPNFKTVSYIENIVQVDPLVYVCFLRFWCSMKMDQNIEKLKARDDMVWCCGLTHISEKAVALNLLAYCHTQLDEYEKAFEALCRALKEKPAKRSTLVYIAYLVNNKLRWSRDGHVDN